MVELAPYTNCRTTFGPSRRMTPSDVLELVSSEVSQCHVSPCFTSYKYFPWSKGFFPKENILVDFLGFLFLTRCAEEDQMVSYYSQEQWLMSKFEKVLGFSFYPQCQEHICSAVLSRFCIVGGRVLAKLNLVGVNEREICSCFMVLAQGWAWSLHFHRLSTLLLFLRGPEIPCVGLRGCLGLSCSSSNTFGWRPLLSFWKGSGRFFLWPHCRAILLYSLTDTPEPLLSLLFQRTLCILTADWPQVPWFSAH